MFMGKVVDIESQPRRRRGRKRPSKTALVLGGGGFTGGVYEIGALLESVPLAYERLVGPLTLRERDQYCAEAAIMEPLLGMPEGWLPRDSAQLDAYMSEALASGSIVVTDTSRAIARALLYPPYWRLAWPVPRAMQLLTIGSLPASIRQAYGFEWRERDERVARATEC